LNFTRFAVAVSLMCVIILNLTGCSGGTTRSGAAADVRTGDLVGVYEGMESVTLARSDDGAVLESQTNRVALTVERDGTLSYSASNGAVGEAQITKNGTFRMRADARTQFGSVCSAGMLILVGEISSDRGITARHASKNLVCNGREHTISGSLSAER